MKKLVALLLAACTLVGIFCGCQTEAKDVTLDASYVIVCTEETGSVHEAALSLQVALSKKCALELELVSEAPKDGKTVTVAVDASLKEGQYRTRIVDGNIAIEAQSAQVMVFAMREIRLNWLGEGAEPVLKAAQLEKLCGTVDLANAPFLVLSQNIRYADDEGGNMVVQRAPRFQLLAREYQPDIICLQEDSTLWSTIVDKYFSENYEHTGFFHGKDMASGNRHAIFFRTERYELVEDGVLWLSETPDEPGTKLADSKSIRSCTWALLKDNFTQQTLFVCNTHLDTKSDEVRTAQLQILLEQLGSYMEQYPTVFVGDFNATPDSPVYATMIERMSDPHVSAEVKLSDIEFTCDQYGQRETPIRIDYMFYNDMLKATKYRVMTDLYDGYISDHFGVTTEYSFVK